MKKIWLLFVLAMFVNSCAYLKRKQCESTNWHEYGRARGAVGGVMDGDKLIAQCRESDGKVDDAAVKAGYKAGRDFYCSGERTFQDGKNGMTFSTTHICTSGEVAAMKKQHLEGVKQYCTPEVGQSVAEAGQSYNGICPTEKLKEAFMSGYKIGRKKYLVGAISAAQSEINSIDGQVTDVNGAIMNKQTQISRLDDEKALNMAGAADDPGAAANVTKIEGAMQRLRNEIQGHFTQITQLRDKQKQLKTNIRNMKEELATF